MRLNKRILNSTMGNSLRFSRTTWRCREGGRGIRVDLIEPIVLCRLHLFNQDIWVFHCKQRAINCPNKKRLVCARSLSLSHCLLNSPFYCLHIPRIDLIRANVKCRKMDVNVLLTSPRTGNATTILI